MPERALGMGRGLAAILAAAPRDGQDELREVPVDLVSPNPRQPRRQFDEEALIALADSIRTRGVIQPILVTPVSGGGYELIAGERRWRAAQAAELDSIPAIVRERDELESLELAVIENMTREDLSPIEEARACAGLVEELGLTREEVGRRIGRSRVAISNLIRLLDLPDEAIELIDRRLLTEGHGRALLLAAENSARRTLARQAVARGWSVRELESRARAANGAEAGTDRPLASAPPASADEPDRRAAADQIADALGRALGADVKVRGGAQGFTAQFAFGSLEEALAFAAGVNRSASDRSAPDRSAPDRFDSAA